MNGAFRAIAACTLASSCGAASASLITFGNTPQYVISSWTEAGYKVSATGAQALLYSAISSFCVTSCSDNGTPWILAYAAGGYTDSVVVKAVDNSLFNLVSFDASEGFSNPNLSPFSGWAAQIRITGVLADDSTISQLATLDQVNDGSNGTLVDFQTFALGLSGAFKEIRFSGLGGAGVNNFVLDNIRWITQIARNPRVIMYPGHKPLT